MADLARIKRNVAKMAGMGAPEADIDAYIASEGVTVEDVRAYKPAPVKTPSTSPAEKSAAPRPNPMRSPLPGPLGGFQDFSNAAQAGFNQGLTFGFGDELYAGGAAIPHAIGDMFAGKGFDVGRAYNDELNLTRAAQGAQSSLNPVASAAGEVTGAIMNPISRLAAGPVGKVAGVPLKAAIGSGEAAALGGVYGFGTGDSFEDRMNRAAIGAGTGAVFGAATPFIGKAVGNALTKGAQRRATSAAIKGAPSADDLKAASSALFKQVDQSGVTVDTNRYSQFVSDLVRRAKKDRINPTLDPKATAAYGELIQALDDAQKSGGALTVSDLHTLRQIAQRAAVSSEGRDAMFANRIVDGLDDFVTQGINLKLPPNRLGSNTAGNYLMAAISTWGRARRVGLIEEAITKAQTYQSGFENGLRLQFQALLKNPKTRKLFTDVERQAIEEVARGTPISNLTRILGKFGFGPNNMLGGTIGASIGGTFGGIPGALGAAALSAGARKASEALGRRAAERAAQVVATPNIPTALPGPKQIAGQELLQRLGLVGAVPALQQR